MGKDKAREGVIIMGLGCVIALLGLIKERMGEGTAALYVGVGVIALGFVMWQVAARLSARRGTSEPEEPRSPSSP